MAFEQSDSFKCGPFVVSKNPNIGQFVEKLNQLRQAIDQCRVMPGIGYTVTRSTGGTTLSIKTPTGATQAAERHPFKIYLEKRKTPESSLPEYMIKIEKNSFVYDSKASSIDKLDKWINLGSQKYDPLPIFLEATIKSMEITEWKIDTSGEKTAIFDPADGSSEQTAARIPLGYIVNRTTGESKVVQNIRSTLRIVDICVGGFAYKYLQQM